MNEIATIMAGLPFVGLLLLCLGVMIAYVLIFAFLFVYERYDLVAIMIVIGVVIYVTVSSYAFGLNM